MPTPGLVTPGNLVKNKTQGAPSRGSQSDEGSVHSHLSIRYFLSIYYVLGKGISFDRTRSLGNCIGCMSQA